jgi:hypothetical protein
MKATSQDQIGLTKDFSRAGCPDDLSGHLRVDRAPIRALAGPRCLTSERLSRPAKGTLATYNCNLVTLWQSQGSGTRPRHAAAAGTAVASLQPVLAQSVPGLKRTKPVSSKNINTARRLLVTRPPRQRPRRIMPVLSHHYVHRHVVFVYGNLLHHLALECTGDQPRARR